MKSDGDHIVIEEMAEDFPVKEPKTGAGEGTGESSEIDNKGFSLQEVYAKIGGYGKFKICQIIRKISIICECDDDCEFREWTVHNVVAAVSGIEK